MSASQQMLERSVKILGMMNKLTLTRPSFGLAFADRFTIVPSHPLYTKPDGQLVMSSICSPSRQY